MVNNPTKMMKQNHKKTLDAKKKGRKRRGGDKEEIGKIENEYQDGRLKPNHIKCKCSKHLRLKGRDFHIGFKNKKKKKNQKTIPCL